MVSSAPVSSTSPLSAGGTTLLHLDFLLTGIVMTFLGPMLPILAARWSLNDALSGRLFLTQFVSSMFGMLLSAPTVQRWGYQRTFIVGLVMMPTGMVLVGSGPFWLGVLGVAVLGFGHGITTPAGNLRTAEVNPGRSASALNVINAFWGIGAMSPSLLLTIARHFNRPTWFLYAIAFLLVVLLVGFISTRFEHDRHVDEDSSAARKWLSPMLMPISLLLFIYVGTENAFGQWVATYAHRLRPDDHQFWPLMSSVFYGAMLVGRSSAPFALKFARERKVAQIGLGLALAGGISLMNAHGTGTVVIGSLLAGLGMASIFPISVSLFPDWFGESVRRASGTIFAGGNLGGAILPWLVGVVSTHSGGLRTAFLVPVTGAASMLIFYLLDKPGTGSEIIPPQSRH